MPEDVIEPKAERVIEPRPFEEMFQLLEKLSELSETKFITKTYPVLNTQSQDKC